MPVKTLPTRTPNTLQEPIALTQAVHAIVRFAHGANEAAEGVDLVITGVATVLVDAADGDLDRGVVFGFDDAVCRGAFAGDVAVR